MPNGPDGRRNATEEDRNAHVRADGGDFEDQELALDEVQEFLKRAAVEAVPGLVLQGVEKELEHGIVAYSFTGIQGGRKCEVEVTADGHVLEIEHGDDGDGDGDGDGGDDDDDDDGEDDGDDDDD